MLTKKNLWFLTLFSIILVMAIYYISMPLDESALVNADVSEISDASISLSESSAITAMKVSRDESLEKEVNAINDILMDAEKTVEEKSDAYEALKSLNNNLGKEESLEKLIKDNYNYDNFVKIENNNVKVVVDTNKHSYELANKIIATIESEFDKNVYVAVSFED